MWYVVVILVKGRINGRILLSVSYCRYLLYLLLVLLFSLFIPFGYLFLLCWLLSCFCFCCCPFHLVILTVLFALTSVLLFVLLVVGVFCCCFVFRVSLFRLPLCFCCQVLRLLKEFPNLTPVIAVTKVSQIHRCISSTFVINPYDLFYQVAYFRAIMHELSFIDIHVSYSGR